MQENMWQRRSVVMVCLADDSISEIFDIYNFWLLAVTKSRNKSDEK